MSSAAGVDAPLLPEFKSSFPEKRASLPGAIFNVSTSIIGAGIMSIPATLKVLGVIPAFLMIVVIAWLAEVSTEFLMRFTSSGESTTYAGIMNESFGTMGAALAQLSLIISTFGCISVFLIIIGDVLSGSHLGGSEEHLGVLEEWFGSHFWNSRAFVLLFIVIFILLPLVLYRHVESLKFSSAVSIVLAGVFVVVCSVMAIYAIFEGKTETPRLVPHLNNQSSFFELFTAIPVIVTAFTFHFNVHPIGFELGKPSHMVTAVRVSLVLCTFIYFSIGLFGYLLFGESIMADILVNFDKSSGSAIGSFLNDIVRLSYALHLVLVFPVMNYSLRANIDEFFFPYKSPLVKDTKRFLSLTLVLLLLIYLAAIAIPNIWFFFQFVGSTTAVSIAFIFPGAIVLRNAHGIATTRDKIMATIMIVLAVVTSTIAITTNIYSSLRN